MKNNIQLSGVYKDTLRRIQKKLDYIPLNPYSAKDVKNELQVYLYDLEKEHKEVEEDSVILDKILENKLYLRTIDHILLWIIFPMVYVSFLFISYLITWRTVIYPGDLWNIVAISTICNILIIERMFLSNRSIVVLVSSAFVVSIFVMIILPKIEIMINPKICIVFIVILLSGAWLLSRVIKNEYNRKVKLKK